MRLHIDHIHLVSDSYVASGEGKLIENVSIPLLQKKKKFFM